MWNPLKCFVSPQSLRDAGVLGMNRRNFDVIAKYNNRRLYPLVDDKVQTKKLAQAADINTPKMIGVIEFQHEVKNFMSIVRDRKEFVIKPAHGSGGKGVLVITENRGSEFVQPSGKILTYHDVYKHIYFLFIIYFQFDTNISIIRKIYIESPQLFLRSPKKNPPILSYRGTFI